MRILIVGDKESERAVLKSALEKLGHEWREAEDGDQGWLAYLDCAPQVILSDYIMPGKNGLELSRMVRSQPFDHYTYIVICSTLAERDHVFEGLRSGADDYLAKPVDTAELELRLLSAQRVTELHQRLAQQKAQLQQLSDQLLAESRKDPLTQVGNRFRFHDESPALLESVRSGHPCTVALCDIDCFKQYNDIYGHLEGDKILKLVAHQLHKQHGEDVRVYRFGGEEFLLTFARHSLEQAERKLETLCHEIEALDVVHVGNQPYGKLTVTFGLTGLEGAHPGDLERALKDADLALYEGKRAGKNRVQRFARPSPVA